MFFPSKQKGLRFLQISMKAQKLENAMNLILAKVVKLRDAYAERTKVS